MVESFWYRGSEGCGSRGSLHCRPIRMLSSVLTVASHLSDIWEAFVRWYSDFVSVPALVNFDYCFRKVTQGCGGFVAFLRQGFRILAAAWKV